jgi:N-acetylmuramoyl-L-alanine amidase
MRLLSILLGYIALCACVRKTSEEVTANKNRLAWTTAHPGQPLIIIDPGHGGRDPGAQIIAAKVQEKELTLRCALFVVEILQKWGYKVTLSRCKDVFVTLPNRVDLANKLGAALFISIHFNSAPNPKAHGAEVFYYRGSVQNPRAQQSKLLAHSIVDSISNNVPLHSRGVHAGNFCVIRETNMPAVLVEGGFLTNQQERERLGNPHYLRRLARAIVQGIDDFVKRYGREVIRPRCELNARPVA